MLIVVILTLTILIAMLSHSVAMILLWLVMIAIVSYIGRWKFNKQNLVVSILVVIIGSLSVIVYDMRMIGLSSVMMGDSSEVDTMMTSDAFVVTSKTRMGRYIIESYPRGEYPQHLLLYSTQSLQLGDVVSIHKTPIQRSYRPQMCRWICKNTILSSEDMVGDMINDIAVNDSLSSDGQTGQVLDKKVSDSSSFTQTLYSTFGFLLQDKEFNYDGRLYMQGVDGSVYDNTTKIIQHETLGPLTEVRNSLFRTITDKFGSTIQAGLILGMTIGDRSLINPERYDQFIDSGLVHLIAVSGGNIAIIVLFVGLLLFWVPFYIRQGLLIIAVIGYASVVGGDTSVIRATIMGLLTMVALFPGRQISVWRSLAYAWCGMLLYNPYYLLYDMGFLLSFGAIIGIIWGERRYKTRLSSRHPNEEIRNSTDNSIGGRITRGVNSFVILYIVPTIGAIVGVLPLLLWSMGSINIATPLVNILIVPLVPLITIVGFLVGILPVGWLSSVGEWFLSLTMDYILWLSVIGTRYSIVIQVVSGLKIMLLLGVVYYWIRWIDIQKE